MPHTFRSRTPVFIDGGAVAPGPQPTPSSACREAWYRPTIYTGAQAKPQEIAGQRDLHPEIVIVTVDGDGQPPAVPARSETQ